jgi:hypothetical protein
MLPTLSFAHWLIVLSAFLSIAGSSVYIRDTLKGTTKPNRVSFSMWALAPLVGTAAAFSIHADVWVIIRIFLSGLMPLLIFFASFINPQSYWKLSLFDLLCGVCSVFALVLWLFVDSARTAILFAALGDGFACIPTLRKAWLYPETETGISYVTSFFSVLLVIPSITIWNIENSAFQIYLLIANALLLFAIYRKKIYLLRTWDEVRKAIIEQYSIKIK